MFVTILTISFCVCVYNHLYQTVSQYVCVSILERVVQAQFSMRGITSQCTKIVASLSPEFATEVRDLILRPPSDAPYDSLCEQLIKHRTVSEQRKL